MAVVPGVLVHRERFVIGIERARVVPEIVADPPEVHARLDVLISMTAWSSMSVKPC